MDPLSSTPVAQALQICGWLLTIAGHVLITLRLRAGWVAWIGANAVLIALSAYVGLWWSIGMYLTNTAACVWSYRHWRRGAAAQRRRSPAGTEPARSNTRCN